LLDAMQPASRARLRNAKLRPAAAKENAMDDSEVANGRGTIRIEQLAYHVAGSRVAFRPAGQAQ
jgi:hypothetical protein